MSFLKKILRFFGYRNNHHPAINAQTTALEKPFEKSSQPDFHPTQEIENSTSLAKVLYTQPKTYPIYLSTTAKPVVELIEEVERKDQGISEDYFWDYLKNRLGENLRNNTRILLPNFAVTPDFVYMDPTNRLYVAIEIDEPYSINNQAELKPIHYKGQDDNRNTALLTYGWNIIRLSEEQVIRDPSLCCEYIFSLIRYGIQNEIKTCAVWSFEEAQKMIESRYRDSYLPLAFSDTSTEIKVNSYRSFEILYIRGLITKQGKHVVAVEFKPNNLFPTYGDDNWTSHGRCYIPEDTFWKRVAQLNLSRELGDRKMIYFASVCEYQINVEGRFEAIGRRLVDSFHLKNEDVFNLILKTETKTEEALNRDQKISVLKTLGVKFNTNGDALL